MLIKEIKDYSIDFLKASLESPDSEKHQLLDSETKLISSSLDSKYLNENVLQALRIEASSSIVTVKESKRKFSLVRRNCDKKSVSDDENMAPEPETNIDGHLKSSVTEKNVTIHKCDLCKNSFTTASLLSEHKLNHCFPCYDCEKVFNDLTKLQDHITIDHDPNQPKKEGPIEEKDSACSIPLPKVKNERCKKYYEQLKSERKYQCKICRKTFITSGHLNTHMHCHSETTWKCNDCNKKFSCERSLIRHQRTFPGKHWFPCKLCDMTFFRVINIVKHMEIKHPEASIDNLRTYENELLLDNTQLENVLRSDSEVKNISCSKCLKLFSCEDTLNIHIKAMHTSDEMEPLSFSSNNIRYKCELCFKEFVSLEGFEYHKNNQHLEKEVKRKKRKKGSLGDEIEENKELNKSSFICKVCSMSFEYKSELQIHLKSHNMTKNVEVKTGSHQCCICPRSFASSDGLKYHLATHTGERRYSCSQCGKKFIKKTHLSEHVATHSRVKYFKCSRCPKTFSTHSAYKKHIKLFPGPHSFPCTKCGKLFSKESMIEKHICVDLVNVTMAPEVKALLSEDMIEEYLCIAEEMAMNSNSKGEETGQEKSEAHLEKSHSCYKCFRVFQNLSLLQSHQLEHIGKQNYQCRFCPENFTRADAFGAHIRDHLGSTPYMCLKCNRKFMSPLTLAIHAKTYPGEHSFTCQKCQRWFPSEKRLQNHECILQNSDFFTCACKSIFKNWNELLEHAGTKPYKCCSCDMTCPTLVALTRHIKRHTGVKPFFCEICGKSFKGKNNYLHHRSSHSATEELSCDHCHFKTKSKKRLNFHLFRKHNENFNETSNIFTTLCTYCGLTFPSVFYMKKHVQSEHEISLTANETKHGKTEAPFLCSICGKLLNNKYVLVNHMKNVHDADISKKEKFKCEICAEQFRNKNAFERHAEKHETPTLRTCEVCNKEFLFASDLRKHMKKHDPRRPFLCSQCGKKFKVSVSLKYHSSICGKNNKKEREVKKGT